LQDYERGVTIRYRQMRELARLLGRPVTWFLYGDQMDEDTCRLARIEEKLDVVLSAIQDL
jgi:hypothetical protein